MSYKMSEEFLIELVSTIGFFVVVVVLCIKGEGVQEYIMPMLFTYLLPSPIHSLIKQPTVTTVSETTQAQSTAQVTSTETGNGPAGTNATNEPIELKDGIIEVIDGITEVIDGLTDKRKV